LKGIRLAVQYQHCHAESLDIIPFSYLHCHIFWKICRLCASYFRIPPSRGALAGRHEASHQVRENTLRGRLGTCT
jgi:hypothetical protein